MSWAVTTFYCSRCDFKAGDFLTWGLKEYILPNKDRISINRRLGAQGNNETSGHSSRAANFRN